MSTGIEVSFFSNVGMFVWKNIDFGFIIRGQDNIIPVETCLRWRDNVVIVLPYFSHDRFTVSDCCLDVLTEQSIVNQFVAHISTS